MIFKNCPSTTVLHRHRSSAAPTAEPIETQREFRDKYLLTNPLGKGLLKLYYKVSPPMAECVLSIQA